MSSEGDMPSRSGVWDPGSEVQELTSDGPRDTRTRRGLLFVVSAPSGTGKTTVVERLVQVVPDLSLSRSYTSRAARPGEIDGIDYNFITRARFEAMIAAQ